MPTELPTLRKHQEREAQYWKTHSRMFNNSDPGTGKTFSTLAGFERSAKGRLLVIAPLSIMRPAWGMDIDKFMPNMTWAIAHGSPEKRLAAFNSTADIVIMNHDGVKWLADNLTLLRGFSHIAVDEYTSFKHRTSDRSKDMFKLANVIEYISLLSGTPTNQSVTNIWFPAKLIDNGARLGKTFFEFRSAVCTPFQVGPKREMVRWDDKVGAAELVTQMLSDITIRHAFEECNDIPPNHKYTLTVQMPAQVMAQYHQLMNESVLETSNGLITAGHAGARTKKILQLLSGAVYDANGNVVKVHSVRTDLVMELIQAREQCVVAFNWKHERDALLAAADKLGITYRVIDGDENATRRESAVAAFQAGEVQVIFAHPQSAGHGLTLTKGTTTIWASGTYNAEWFKQFNARIYRSGQTRKTETICIAAAGTKEEEVYEILSGRLETLSNTLQLFADNTAEEYRIAS